MNSERNRTFQMRRERSSEREHLRLYRRGLNTQTCFYNGAQKAFSAEAGGNVVTETRCLAVLKMEEI